LTHKKALPFPNGSADLRRGILHQFWAFWQVSMNEVTRILADLAKGDAQAAEELFPLVYEELRKLAAARMAARRPPRPPLENPVKICNG
jgi:hypothetical protein